MVNGVHNQAGWRGLISRTWTEPLTPTGGGVSERLLGLLVVQGCANCHGYTPAARTLLPDYLQLSDLQAVDKIGLFRRLRI